MCQLCSYFYRNVDLDIFVPFLGEEVHCTVNIPNGPSPGNGIVTKCLCALKFSSTVPLSRVDFLVVTEKISGQRCVSSCLSLRKKKNEHTNTQNKNNFSYLQILLPVWLVKVVHEVSHCTALHCLAYDWGGGRQQTRTWSLE